MAFNKKKKAKKYMMHTNVANMSLHNAKDIQPKDVSLFGILELHPTKNKLRNRPRPN